MGEADDGLCRADRPAAESAGQAGSDVFRDGQQLGGVVAELVPGLVQRDRQAVIPAEMVEGNQPYDEQAAGTTGAPDRRSRRRLLAGATGVLGLAAAEVAGQAAPAQANNGNPVLQGTDNTFPTRRTAVFTPSNAEVGILADPNSSGKGSLGVYGIGGDAGCSAKAPPAPPASACRGSAPRCGQRGRWPRRGGWRLKARWPMVTAALE